MSKRTHCDFRFLLLSCWGLSAIVLSPFCLSADEFQGPPDRPVDILHIKLDLDVSLKERSVTGTATVQFSARRVVQELQLDAVNFEVQRSQLLRSGASQPTDLTAINNGRQLTFTLPTELQRGDEATLTIEYQVRDPEAGLHFFQPTDSDPEIPWMVWSQGEPEANRNWFPCIDSPSERQTTEILATVDANYEVLSNGELVSRETAEEADRVTYHWRQTEPHASYLVTLVVGEFAIVKQTWRGKPVMFYVPKSRQQDVETTFNHTPEMLEHFSDRFGIEYPWNKYAQVVVEQFLIGGMENTSATTLNDSVLHTKRALLDSSPDWLIAHELGHQWWGDLVTCKDWSDIWLNEGFATYCEILWAEHSQGWDEAEYQLVRKSRSARSGTDRPIVDHFYNEPWDMFDNRAYPKGGWVLHMLRRKLGDADFFTGLKRYGLARRMQTAETADLRVSLTELTGEPLQRFFYDWTQRGGHPVLKVSSEYLADDKLVKISVTQEQKADPFEFPLTVELLGKADQKSQRMTRTIQERDSVWYLPASERPAGVRIDPDFAVLCELKEEKARDWWERELVDGGIAERIRTVEHFADGKSDQNRETLAKVLKQDDFYGVRIEAAKALGRSGGDIARDALLEGLKDKDARVRAEAAEALHAFEGDEQAQAALEDVVNSDEQAYSVIAASLTSLAQLQTEPTADLFLEALKVDSHREQVRAAALEGLTRVDDVAVIDTLRDWAKPGHPWRVRIIAIASLANWFTRFESPQPVKTQVAEEVLTYLREETPRVRRAAAVALGKLGESSDEIQDALQAVVEHDVDSSARESAKNALAAIRNGTSEQSQRQQLQSDVEALRKSNQELKERLDRLEAK